MSITEGIKQHESGTTLTGQGITFYRYASLKSAMKLELETGIRTGNGLRPFNLAVEWFGLEWLAEIDDEDRVLNKDAIYEAVTNLSDQEAVDMIEHCDEYRKNVPPPPPVEATGNSDEKVFEIFNGYFKVTQAMVCDLLITALEGGSNYWYFIVDSKRPTDPANIPSEHKDHFVGECWADGYVTFCDKEEYYGNDESIKPSEIEPTGVETWNLTEEKVIKGLELMAQKHKEFWIGWVLNDDIPDGDDADTFLQYCLFGEVVYG